MWKPLGKSHLKKLPWWTLSIGAAALFVHYGSADLSRLLQMDRNLLSNGAIWQVVTGHLSHWNSEHLWADLAVFLTMGVMIERKSPLQFILLFFTSAIAISLSVLLFRPEIQTYRGLSGIDMALAAYWCSDCLIQTFKKHSFVETTLWSLGLAGILLKPVIEIIIGHPIFVQDLGTNVVGMSIPHVVGAVIGIFLLIASNNPIFSHAGKSPKHLTRLTLRFSESRYGKL